MHRGDVGAQVKGHLVGGQQVRHQPGFKQAGLASAALGVQHGELVALQMGQELADGSCAAVEKRSILQVVLEQSFVGIGLGSNLLGGSLASKALDISGHCIG